MKTIVIANQKGGVAKTTTATTLAEGLVAEGRRVLLIDTDPQCNATNTYGGKVSGCTTLYDVLIDGTPIAEAIQKTLSGDILPCDPLLAGADAQLVKLGKEHLLRKALSEVAAQYDYAIIDTTPALGILLINALTAADGVLVPVPADTFSMDGLTPLIDTVKQIREYTNPALAAPELIITRWSPRTKLARRCAEELQIAAKALGATVLPVMIRECVAVREAQELRRGLLSYAPNSTSAEDYRQLVKIIKKQGGVNDGKE